MSRSTLPLFPTDEGWPYPDAIAKEPAVDDELDLDALELRIAPHAFDGLTLEERAALFSHFGLQGCERLSMKHLGPSLGCSRSEAHALLESAMAKVRTRLLMS
jgi:DNA-directed RNA polymerase specialized sigma24 family protein